MQENALIIGGGCFWCTEAVFQMLKGVKSVESGYANGERENPTYQDICTGQTGHAEVIKIIYDNTLISERTLLEIFFATHNPTTLNQQGADRGTQYRSTILFQEATTKEIAQNLLKEIQNDYKEPIVTTIEPLKCYYKAEEYHQNYYQTNPHQGYCMAVIPPKLAKLKEKFSDKMVL